MGFHDVQFPTDISYGSQGGSGWNTGIVELDSGAEEAYQRWSSSKHQYDAAYGVKTRAQLVTVMKFLDARNGSANRFRYKDWTDYASTADGGTTAFSGAGGGAAATTNADQQIGVGDGVKTTFQLVKRYTSGPTTYVRNITRPIAGTLLVSFDTGGGPVNQSSGFTLDTSTGVVTFTTPPANGTVVRAGFEFDVPVRFDERLDKTGIVWRFVDGDVVEAQSIVLVEVPEGPAIDEDFFSGGFADLGVVSASFTVNLGLGRAQVWQVNTASLNATMPAEANIPDGFPILAVKNTGSQSIQVKASTGTNQFTIAAGATAIFMLATPNNIKTWLAF